MSRSSEAPPVRPREIFGWAMFDFANSSYTTVVITVAFAVFFTSTVAAVGRADFLWGTGCRSRTVGALLSLVVGAIADSGKSGSCSRPSPAAGTRCSRWSVGDVAPALALLVVRTSHFRSANLAGRCRDSRTIGRISGPAGVGYRRLSLMLISPRRAGLAR
jgi:hypothetical protein